MGSALLNGLTLLLPVGTFMPLQLAAAKHRKVLEGCHRVLTGRSDIQGRQRRRRGRKIRRKHSALLVSGGHGCIQLVKWTAGLFTKSSSVGVRQTILKLL